MTTFTTSPLISAARIVENPVEALRVIPEGMMLLDHHTPLQSAALCELNRFPGWPVYRWIPLGEEREEALTDVEERAKQWEAVTGRPLALSAPITVRLYVENLRQLLLCVDLERAEIAAREGDILEIEESNPL